MTAVIEPTLFDTPHAEPVDAQTAALLDLIGGDPIHATDRATIAEGIRECVRMNDGVLDPNMLRAWLRDDETGECIVYPACIGATVAALRHAGRLVEDGWVVTTGSSSGNNGRPARAYRWVAA